VQKEDVTAEHLRLIVDRLSDGIVLFNIEGICQYLNPEAVRIVGKPASEVIGKHIGEAVPDAMSHVVEGARDRLIAGEEVLLVRSFFAQARWFEILGRPLGGSFVVHFRDITERLQAESARRQSEERFRILVNGVRDHSLVMLDPKGQIVSWNAGAERISGFTPGEVLGKPLSVLLPPELVENGEPRRRLEAAVTQGSVSTEHWGVRKDGSRYLVESTYTSLVDDQGVPSGFAIVNQDVTERRKAEEVRRSNEERLRLAVEAGAIGTWEEILGTKRLVANRRFLELCGLPPDDRLSLDDFLTIIHPDDVEYFQQQRKHVLELEGESEFEFEYRVMGRADHEARWVESHGRVMDSGNEPGHKRVIGVLRDTTKRHQIDEFRELAAGVVAHDLRSPLSAIKLTSQVLVEREALPETAVQRVKTIVRKVDRMVNIVERVLLYTQARFGGGLPLDKRLADLGEVCRDAISDVVASHPDREIRFKTGGDLSGIWDQTRLTEVATNLLGNAVKHGQPGRPIDVVARDEGDQVELEVHNLGPAIPTEAIPLIFQPFRRAATHAGAGESSFGLGLYIVREIVAAHGGTVDVSSSVEAGTTFIVHLPRDANTHPAGPAHQ
jgi:PAS domain S-box-containing protein